MPETPNMPRPDRLAGGSSAGAPLVAPIGGAETGTPPPGLSLGVVIATSRAGGRRWRSACCSIQSRIRSCSSRPSATALVHSARLALLNR